LHHGRLPLPAVPTILGTFHHSVIHALFVDVESQMESMNALLLQSILKQNTNARKGMSVTFSPDFL